jgi:hypothetical protein
MADKDAPKTSKEPFVSDADRPEVRLKSDTPLTELRVRDLAVLLGQLGGTRKDFWDGKSWQKDDFDGPVVVKDWKEDKEFKEYKEIKESKEKDKEKEKDKDKREGKELKIEKLESDGVFDPGTLRRPDPRLDQVVQALSGLTDRVAQLADQVEELRKARGG